MRALLFFLWAALAWLAPAAGQGPLPVPELTARVIDQTGTLDDIQRKALEDKLAAFEQKKGSQMVFLMLRSTAPEDIASYANRVGNAWKIGRKEVGDGILLVVAKDDRRVRIEVAKTLEGAVPDLAASQIIETAITPHFRRGDYAAGLHGAADQLISRVTGEPLPEPAQPQSRGNAGIDWFDGAIFLFFLVPFAGGILRSMLGRKLGSVATAGAVGVVAMLFTSSLVIAVVAGIVALLFAFLSGGGGGGLGGGMRGARRTRRGHWGGVPVILPGGGWGGGGGGGFGGGGFGSGGGGDFGGGGASGSW